MQPKALSPQLEYQQPALATLLDQLSSMIGYWDNNVICRFANRAYSRFFQIDPALLRGMHMRALLGNEMFDDNSRYVEAVLGGTSVSFERTFRGRGRSKAYDTVVHFVPDIAGGAVRGFYSLEHDVMEVDRLQESEGILEAAERASGVGGFMIDLASDTQKWTRQAYRINDVEDGRSPADELTDAVLTSIRVKVQEALRRASDGADDFNIEMPLVTAKARPIWIRMTGEVERLDGVPKRIVGAMQDITEQRLMEQKLRDESALAQIANHSKSQFLAHMSHEIRTPLSAVIGLGFLLEQTLPGEEQRQLLSKIQVAGRSLLGVVNNVLDLSKVEAGEMLLEDETFNLADLVRDVGQMLAPQATGKGIELKVECAADLPSAVNGDALRLRQTLINFVGNAIKFTEAGSVEIKAFCLTRDSAGIRLRCEVSDSGIGIEPDALERLFPPLTQADASTSRRFVELMGGDIGVTSTVGVGSTFWIEIPLRIDFVGEGRKGADYGGQEQELHAAPFHNQETQWLAGVRVLVADDSDINREVAKRILENQGAIVTTCGDGHAAVENVRLHHRQLDIVLMDVQMPLLDGVEAARRIRREIHPPALPILALTAGALVGERRRALESGMTDFITKPFAPLDLLSKVRRLVEQGRGSPIPMVFIDRLPITQTIEVALPPSIDAATVRRIFGNDQTLFRSLLDGMLRDFEDLALPILLPPDEPALGTHLESRLHELLGCAGPIGARDIVRLAGDAGQALREERTPDVVSSILEQLAAALTTLREEAAAAPRGPSRAARNGSAIVTGSSVSGADIDELCALLENQNLAAVDKFTVFADSLSERLGGPRFDRLRDAIDNLDFRRGAELLRCISLTQLRPSAP